MTTPAPEADYWAYTGYPGDDCWNWGPPGDGLGVIGWQEHDPYRDPFQPFGSTAEEAWPCRGESPSGPLPPATARPRGCGESGPDGVPADPVAVWAALEATAARIPDLDAALPAVPAQRRRRR